jgi:hypothetical protein
MANKTAKVETMSKEDKENASLLMEFVKNQSEKKILNKRLKVIGERDDEIFKSVRPIFGKKKTIDIQVGDYVFRIEKSGKKTTPYKELLKEAEKKLSTLSKKVYNEMLALKTLWTTQPGSKESLKYTEIKSIK